MKKTTFIFEDIQPGFRNKPVRTVMKVEVPHGPISSISDAMERQFNLDLLESKFPLFELETRRIDLPDRQLIRARHQLRKLKDSIQLLKGQLAIWDVHEA